MTHITKFAHSIVGGIMFLGEVVLCTIIAAILYEIVTASPADPDLTKEDVRGHE